MHVTKLDEALIQVNVLSFLLIEGLQTTENRVNALLQSDSQPVCQVNIDLLADVLRKDGRNLLECLRKLTVLLRVLLVLEVADLQISLLDLHSKLLLEQVGLHEHCVGHVGEQKGAHTCLLDDIVRLCLVELVQHEHHVQTREFHLNLKVLLAPDRAARLCIADEVQFKERV